MGNKPSRQMIFGYVSMLFGFFSMIGVELDAETKVAIVDNIEVIIGALSVLYGIAMVILRKVTNSPMLGWLFKEQ